MSFRFVKPWCPWLVLAVACGAPPRPAAPPPAPPPAPAPSAAAAAPAPAPTAPPPLLAIDWRAVRLATDADALALWQQIAPTGADWTLRLGELPDDDAVLKPLALALLRAGGFACPARSTCADAGPREVAPDATLADPCLRRELALWAFDRLDEEDAPAIVDALVAIAGLPAPEDELIDEAFGLVPAGSDELLLRMIAAAKRAGQDAAADDAVRWLSAQALDEAARVLHVDGAYALLDVAEARASFLSAVLDSALRPQTRIDAMAALVEQAPLPRDASRVLHKATADARCEVAGAAARLLAESGQPRYRPRPTRGSLATVVRALCVAYAYEQAHSGIDDVLRGFVSRDGLAIIDHSAIGEDPTAAAGDLIPRADLVTLPFAEELGPALEHCAGATCRFGGVRFELAFDAARALRRIDRFDDTPPCADPEQGD